MHKKIYLSQDLGIALDLAKRIKSKVRLLLGAKDKISDKNLGKISGDYQHRIDKQAENIIRKYFVVKKFGSKYGYFTEERGLVLPKNYGPKTKIFYIDPIDGTRTAMSGSEECTVSIAVVPFSEKAALKNISSGVIAPLKEKMIYVAEKNKGVLEIDDSGKIKKLSRLKPFSTKTKDLCCTIEEYGVPYRLMAILDPLRKAIYFNHNFPCSSYALLMLIRRQTQIHVDARKNISNIFGKKALFFREKFASPLDIAPAYLMINELGGVISDIEGNPLDKSLLWQKTGQIWFEGPKISILGAASRDIHKEALQKIKEGIKILKKGEDEL